MSYSTAFDIVVWLGSEQNFYLHVRNNSKCTTELAEASITVTHRAQMLLEISHIHLIGYLADMSDMVQERKKKK